MSRLVLTAALALGLTVPALSLAAIPQPVHFWGDVAAMIEGPGISPQPEVIRPSRIILFADGSWDVEQLHWTGWGSRVAHAKGISSASNGVPNMAQGMRITAPAQIALSSPGRFQGHEVYRCFTLTVAPSADGSSLATNEHECVSGAGGYWYFTQATAPTTTPATTVRFYTPSGNIACAMVDAVGPAAGVDCDMRRPVARVHLAASGRVTICQHQGLKCAGDLGVSPSIPNGELRYGAHRTLGRFRCSSAFTGVTCIVTATGKGFFISRQSVKRVG